MLAFAQRIRLTPEIVDLNRLVSTFGEDSEKSHARPVERHLANDLWPVVADPKAVENMLLALALNGTEAMPKGGGLKIVTENIFHTLPEGQHFPSELTPGRYVRLSVSDRGTGIKAEHMAQIFDPFFTTKAVGEGTGLGLSMVLGVIRQSGGTVAVRSEIGLGSTFALYFPASPCGTDLPSENH